MKLNDPSTKVASGSAYAGAVSFVALIGLFSAGGTSAGALLGLHAFAAHWVPEWTIYPPFVLIPIWLTLVGPLLRRPGLGRS